MIYEIINEPKGKEYKELIKFAVKKSDVLMFVIRRDRYKGANYDVINKISKILNVETKDVEDNYKDYIKNRYEELYNNYRTILEHEIKLIPICAEIDKKEISEEVKKRMLLNIEAEIESRKKAIIQEKYMKELKEKFKKYLVKEKHDNSWTMTKVDIKEKDEKGKYMFDICFYKICPEVEKFLLERNSLYAFEPPYLPEDIAFYKDGYCWFYTISHEKIGTMDIENKEDREYIKKIGIETQEYEINEKDERLFKKF